VLLGCLAGFITQYRLSKEKGGILRSDAGNPILTRRLTDVFGVEEPEAKEGKGTSPTVAEAPEIRPPCQRPKTGHKVCAHCTERVDNMGSYATHLREVHGVKTTKTNLGKYELGECPYCHKYFTAKRGWSKHVPACRSRTPLDLSIEWPRRCWVWWHEDKIWYAGMGMGIRNEALSYTVIYDDKTQERELDQHVVFSDPALEADPIAIDDAPPDPPPIAEELKVLEHPESDLEEGEVRPTPDEREHAIGSTIDGLPGL